jgi:hypothetical protein
LPVISAEQPQPLSTRDGSCEKMEEEEEEEEDAQAKVSSSAAPPTAFRSC